MKNPRIIRWKNLPATTGLLLFAQGMEEALFDFTLDSYKAPALNTHTRCNELITTSQDVLSHRINPKALEPIVEELAQSILSDDAARKLLGPHVGSVGAVDWWRATDPVALRTQAEFVRGFLRRRAYEKTLIASLRELVEDGREKRAILSMAVNLVVEWRSRGFSSHFIYYRTKGHFFSFVGPLIVDMTAFDSFIAHFDVEPRDFEVVLRAARAWHELAATMPTDLAHIQLPPLAPRTHLPKETGFFAKPNQGVYITVKGISALDARAAAEEAAARMRSMASLAGLHLHRSPMLVEGEAVAYEGNHPVVLRGTLPPLHREEDCAGSDLPSRFLDTITALGPNHLTTESWARVAASLNLHASAVASTDPSVQLTGLWAALEAILPASPDESKVQTAVRILVPALCRFYALNLFQDLHASLEACCATPYAAALAVTPSTEPASLRCARLVAIPDNEKLRDTLYGALAHNPLLRHRIFVLMNAFRSGDAAEATLNAHERRVAWQIRRIYRARNLLLHSGRSLPYRDALLENLHAYFHELLRAIQRLCESNTPPSNLDSALLRLTMDHDLHMSAVKKLGKAPTTAASLRAVLLGPTGEAT